MRRIGSRKLVYFICSHVSGNPGAVIVCASFKSGCSQSWNGDGGIITPGVNNPKNLINCSAINLLIRAVSCSS
jgi:hypothetical protein